MPGVRGRSTNPFLYYDTVLANLLAENDESVMTLTAQSPELISRSTLRDEVVAIFLTEYQAKARNGRADEALSALRMAARLRPFDLATNHHLWQLAMADSDSVSAHQYDERFVRFSSEALQLENERLDAFTLTAVPDLVAHGLWSIERTENIVGYWVWRYSESSSLESLLRKLTAQFPQNAQLWYLLGELYDRRGQPDQASRSYRQSLQVRADYRPAELRLKELSAASGTGAANLGKGDPTGDAQLVADLLGLSPEAVRLGPNLIQGDLFTNSSTEKPEGWGYGVYAGAKNDWQFVAGRDADERSGSMRLVNLWWPLKHDGPDVGPYAEYGGGSFAAPEWLALSLDYRVQGLSSDAGLVLVGTDGNPNWQA